MSSNDMSSNKLSSNDRSSNQFGSAKKPGETDKAGQSVRSQPLRHRANENADPAPSMNREALNEILVEERAPPQPPARTGRAKQKTLFDVLKDSVPRPRGRNDRQTALVPESSISGRALVIVVIIMTFLASMTAGAVELIATASASWSEDVTRELTIQVRPRGNRDLDADVNKATDLARGVPGIDSVRAYTKQESERLLEPWLGSSLPFDQMPVPRIVVLSLDPKVPLPDFTALKRQLADAVPTATLDDHRQWSARLATMARALVLVGLMVLALVLIATGLAIAFATRGAMAGTREIINVLHLVGAEDRFIADEFQRHFLMMGLRGGLIGSALAVMAFLFAGALSSRWIATPQGEQIEALFGTFTLGARGYVAVICIAFVVAGLTAIVTRRTVYRNLRDIA